jgi:hypothetical protein
LVEADSELTTARGSEVGVLATLEAALRVAERIQRGYLEAPDQTRRQINQGFFKKLFIGEDGSVEHAELNEPFASLDRAAEHAARMVAGRDVPEVAAGEAVDAAEDEREIALPGQRATPTGVFKATFGNGTTVTDSENKTTHREIFSVRGLNEVYVVGAAGFEPATARV